MNWVPLLWLAATLALLLVVERWIHRHLQGTMLLLTGVPDKAVILYWLPLLPGVALHEISHFFAALLLGAKVGNISLRPMRAGQRVQLGFVPVEKTDAVRASLIGLAPLLTGSAVILLIGYAFFDIGSIQAALLERNWANVVKGLGKMLHAPDVWLWAYIVFAVSNTMLPSRADRQAWTPVVLFLLIIGVLIWIAGLGPTVIEKLADPLTVALAWLATMCTLTVLADLPFALLIALVEKMVGRAKGMQVEY